MSETPENIHGTAITVDGIGLLFVGPSGSGKSSIAFDCLAEARLMGCSGALISDDRVLVTKREEKITAAGPEQIRGLIELRYTGIVAVDHIAEADLHYAILPVSGPEADRLPADQEVFTVTPSIQLPAIRLPSWSRFPLALIFARIRSLHGGK
jgi:serine kinase of HPr protein (carbohydrate metabolism regulator)